MPPLSGPSAPSPQKFQRTMVFVDGTNLFNRLQESRLRLLSLKAMCEFVSQPRDIVRIYMYTVQPQLKKFEKYIGPSAFDGIRIEYGDAISIGGGNIKEKCVDAMLVADLIYHAATKNVDYATLVSADSDFSRALKRVEDFGCRTQLVTVCDSAPDRLRDAADSSMLLTRADVIANRWAEECSVA